METLMALDDGLFASVALIGTCDQIEGVVLSPFASHSMNNGEFELAV